MAVARKYLIVGPSWVGDMVMAHTLFQVLRSSSPDCDIDVIAPPWTHPLLGYMKEVRESLVLPFKHGEFNLQARRRLGKSLIAKSYTDAIILPNSFKSALIPWFANIPTRTGWLGEIRYGLLNNIKKLDKQRYPLMIERFMALGNEDEQSWQGIRPKLEVPDVDRQHLIEKFKLELSLGQPYVFSPGAEYGPAKRWPYYGEVARKLSNEGYPVWILGSPKDEVIAKEIMQDQNALVRNFVGKTSLSDAIGLLSMARFVLTNDSGLMHVAAALDKPMLAIYGSSDIRFTPPLSDKARVYTLKLKCSPCFKRICPLGHMDCLNKIDAEMVLDEIALWERACVS